MSNDNGGIGCLIPIVAIIGAAFYFSDGFKKTVANWFWEYEPAPWETVDAYFYLDQYSREKYILKQGLKSINDCQVWARSQASLYNDPYFRKTSYLCFIGKPRTQYGAAIYRTNAK